MIVLHYLKDRLLAIIVFLMSFLILSFLFFLYRYELDMIIYAYMLIGVLILGVCIIDFYRYYKQHETLTTLQIKNNVSLSPFILDTSLKGQDYKKILQAMDQDKLRIIEENEARQKEQMDYFTLWAHQAKLPIAAMRLCLDTDPIDQKELKMQLLRMEQYTDMVLAYLRMNSTQTDYVFREQDLDDLIRQAIRHFSSEFIYRKVMLDFKETHTCVLTDEKWFVFVLEQFLSNALKYTNPKGKIMIYLQDEHELVIEDNGIGIEQSDLKRVFERGFTGYNGRIDKKASGLGLYLCKEILDKLNHSIAIESKRHQGTKVIITLDRYDFGILKD